MVVSVLDLISAAVLPGGKEKPVISVSAQKSSVIINSKKKKIFYDSYLQPTMSKWWKLHQSWSMSVYIKLAWATMPRRYLSGSTDQYYSIAI